MTSQEQFPLRDSRGSLVEHGAHGLAPYAAGYPTDDDAETEFSISEILSVLWERKWWIGLAALIGLVLALGYSLAKSPMYRATATIELNPPTVPVLSNGGESGENLVVPTTDRQFQETQLGILRSRALAERVVQDLSLAGAVRQEGAKTSEQSVSDLAALIAADLTVRPSPDSRLVELTYVSDDPREAAKLVNGFAASFIDLTLDRKYEATTSARKFLEGRIAVVRDEVNDAERRLVAYAKQNGIIVVPGSDGSGSTTTLTGESLGALNAALANAQQKRITAEQRFRQAGSLTDGAANAAGLRQEKAGLEAEYREKSTYLQDSFPEMARLKSRIDELDRQISLENSRAAGALGAEYRAALAEEQALQARVSQLSGSALSEREDSVQYNILQRELDTSRSLYDALLERYNEVGVVEGVGSAQAAMVDQAQVPSVPFEPSILRNVLLGVLLGLALGSGLSLLYDRLTNTVKTKDDLREKLGIAALGAIPLAEKGAFLEEVRDPYSQVYDAYASLRTGLQLSTLTGFPRVLLVTSSRPEEGKSSTSYSLGVQLSDTGKRVLLIDADMRRPSFLTRQSEFGLSTLLTTPSRLSEHLVGTTSENLSLLPSGPTPPNPANIIVAVRLEAILAEARELFDHIIIDAPPVANFADAILLAMSSDGVLFAIESGKTRTTVARAALSQLRMAKANLLGGTLTKASGRAVDYGYGYGTYYSGTQRSSETSIQIAEYLDEPAQRHQT
ncbi:GumC family protein [Porphyrobacter sp. AAP60]|uniref:GumC family protein n=1 Tax=Porphyrobacter sp. AAP60 TaxID=1523423 RepID=UPI0009EBE378|nr:polysaccharide biosynthesis tyrosine autokinase [Porphyrobacter sp. AAP60]